MTDSAILKRLREILAIPGDRVGKARRITAALREAGFPWVGIRDRSGLLAWSPPSPGPPRRSVLEVPIPSATGEPLGMLEVASDLPEAFGDEQRRGLEAIAEMLGPLWNV